MKLSMRTWAATIALTLTTATMVAQAPDDNTGSPMGRSIRGTVSAIDAPFFTIKTDDGEVWQVKLGPNARLVKGGGRGMRGEGRRNRDDSNQEPPQTISVSDIHVGDMLAAGGDVDAAAKKVNAAFAFVVDAATVQKLAADWGITYIAGKVTAVDADDAKITVQRPDGKSATIQADENTSFRKARESITLADIKVGDTVTGRGAQKNGVFTPETLVVFDPNARRGPRGAGRDAQKAPDAPPSR